MPSDHLESVFDAAEGKWQCYGVYSILFYVNRVPKCDVTKILFLENCKYGLKV